MKRTFAILCAISAVFAFSSCRTQKESVNLSDINGEWNIIEINGAEVVPAAGKDFPHIGFDTSTGRIYGNSGCNRMMGSFDINAKAGEINPGSIAGTRMMCPDMTIESNVLHALNNVTGYKKAGTGKIALVNSGNRPVIVLGPREVVLPITSLAGEWKISKIKGVTVPADLEKKPFIIFDLKAKRIHGNAGCNMINGSIITEESNIHSLSFPAIAVTMMACPDMDYERKVLDALNAVKTFDVSSDKSVTLFDEDGKEQVLLKKK